MQNPAILKEIEGLDPVTDCQRIVYLMVAYEFTHEIVRALDVAYLGSGGNKAVADILGRSQYLANGMKRYDDTRFLILKFLECGWDQEEGARAIRQMNMIHSKYRIENRQFVLALCVFMVTPLFWIEKFGWRALTERERGAWFRFWINIGHQMDLHDMPGSLESVAELLDGYYTGREDISEYSKVLGESTMEIFVAKAPWYFRPFARTYYRTFFRESLVRAFGLAELPLVVKAVVFVGVKLNSLRRKVLAPSPFPYLVAFQPLVSYQDTVPRVESAGPDHIVKRMGNSAG